MYVQENVQCIVLNHKTLKNLKLSSGSKVYINQALQGLDIVQGVTSYMGEWITIILPVASLGTNLPRGVMAKQNLHIKTSTPSSLSKEDSNLLRQPSD